jgi:hypothetical protein
MRQRLPAQMAIEQLLRLQGTKAVRTPLARFFGRSPLGPDSRGWYLGAQSSIEAGAHLALLPADWTVFHALPLGNHGTDIDHLVVGPGGLFTIKTKLHLGKRVSVIGRTLLVAGHRAPYIRSAEFEADRVTQVIRSRIPLVVPAQSILAIVGAKQLTIEQMPRRVTVVDVRHLRRALLKLRPVLTTDESSAIVAVIDDPATWSVLPLAASEQLMARFSAVAVDVRHARGRRTLWAMIGCTVAVTGLVIIIPPVVVALVDLVIGTR